MLSLNQFLCFDARNADTLSNFSCRRMPVSSFTSVKHAVLCCGLNQGTAVFKEHDHEPISACTIKLQRRIQKQVGNTTRARDRWHRAFILRVQLTPPLAFRWLGDGGCGYLFTKGMSNLLGNACRKCAAQYQKTVLNTIVGKNRAAASPQKAICAERYGRSLIPERRCQPLSAALRTVMRMVQ